MWHKYDTFLGILISIIHKYSFLAVVYYCGLVIGHVKSEQKIRGEIDVLIFIWICIKEM